VNSKTETTDRGLWTDDCNTEEWANVFRRGFTYWFGFLAGESKVGLNLHVKVSPLSLEEAKRAFECNTNLEGRVSVWWAEDTVELQIPMPFHGVFLT
jgi:hypothetical protein